MIKDGGPAFPTDSERQIGPNAYHYEGITMRDWFATHASEGDIKQHLTWHAEGTVFSRTREQARYHYADAMIEAREFGDEA